MKNLNYTVGTELKNTMTGGTLVITNITDKKVSLYSMEKAFVYRANKNVMTKAVCKKSDFELNVLEGRLVIQ